MADIVVGIASSHTPQLSSGVDMWPDHAERDRRNPARVIPAFAKSSPGGTTNPRTSRGVSDEKATLLDTHHA